MLRRAMICPAWSPKAERLPVESFLKHGDPLPPKLGAQHPQRLGIDIPVGIPFLE